MRSKLAVVALECLVDLGITLAYAVVVGLVIVGIVASDDGPISLLRAGIYALALPVGVVALILAEIVLRLFKDWRQERRWRPKPALARPARATHA